MNCVRSNLRIRTAWHSRIWFLVIFTCVTAVVPSPVALSFDRLVVFGDSTSDSGNVFAMSSGLIPQSPPYFNGRSSNGPVWVEYLADELGVERPDASLVGGTNYAFAGAQTGFGLKLNRAGDFLIPTIGQQIANFLAVDAPAEGDLFTLMAGSNDFSFGADPRPGTVLANLSSHVASLAEAGAREILLVNLAGGSGESNRRVLSDLWFAESRRLATELNFERHWFDHRALVIDIFVNQSEFGIRRFNPPALNNETGEIDADPNSIFCWDNRCHMTTRMHQLFAERVAETLPQIPEPNSFVMLLCGGILLGMTCQIGMSL